MTDRMCIGDEHRGRARSLIPATHEKAVLVVPRSKSLETSLCSGMESDLYGCSVQQFDTNGESHKKETGVDIGSLLEPKLPVVNACPETSTLMERDLLFPPFVNQNIENSSFTESEVQTVGSVCIHEDRGSPVGKNPEEEPLLHPLEGGGGTSSVCERPAQESIETCPPSELLMTGFSLTVEIGSSDSYAKAIMEAGIAQDVSTQQPSTRLKRKESRDQIVLNVFEEATHILDREVLSELPELPAGSSLRSPIDVQSRYTDRNASEEHSQATKDLQWSVDRTSALATDGGKVENVITTGSHLCMPLTERQDALGEEPEKRDKEFSEVMSSGFQISHIAEIMNAVDSAGITTPQRIPVCGYDGRDNSILADVVSPKSQTKSEPAPNLLTEFVTGTSATIKRVGRSKSFSQIYSDSPAETRKKRSASFGAEPSSCEFRFRSVHGVSILQDISFSPIEVRNTKRPLKRCLSDTTLFSTPAKRPKLCRNLSDTDMPTPCTQQAFVASLPIMSRSVTPDREMPEEHDTSGSATPPISQVEEEDFDDDISFEEAQAALTALKRETYGPIEIKLSMPNTPVKNKKRGGGVVLARVVKTPPPVPIAVHAPIATPADQHLKRKRKSDNDKSAQTLKKPFKPPLASGKALRSYLASSSPPFICDTDLLSSPTPHPRLNVDPERLHRKPFPRFESARAKRYCTPKLAKPFKSPSILGQHASSSDPELASDPMEGPPSSPTPTNSRTRLLPSSDQPSMPSRTSEIAALEGRRQTLIQALKIVRNEEDEDQLRELHQQWLTAGREMSEKLFSTVPEPVHEQEETRYDGGFGRDEGAGGAAGDAVVKDWTIGTMLEALSVDPTLFGWNAELEDWQD